MEMEMEMEQVRIKIENGAMLDAPVYNAHRNTKNWMAQITLDPKAPGGIARKFCAKARGDYYYVIDGVKVGDAVEFGADYYTYGGRKQPERWYGVVVELTEEEIVFERAADARAAIELAKEIEPKEPECPLSKFSTEELINELRRRGIDVNPA